MSESLSRWCLLTHALPTRPLYLRARVRRLLAEAGAAPLKKAVYVQPYSAAAYARLAAIAAEIRASGASAHVGEARFLAGEEDAVIEAFNQERHARYRAWMREAASVGDRRAPDRHRRIARLRERLDALRAHDRFGAPGAAEAGALLARLAGGPQGRSGGSAAAADLLGLRWVTRRGLHVDRIACAWVVRRWIDPHARFRWTDRPDQPLAPGEIGFDMPGAAITHEQGRCSVETLVRRAGVTDPAVRRIAEIVHDIDLKDGRYGHAETTGFEQLLIGTIAAQPDDDARAERGADLFDALYTALEGGPSLRGAGFARRALVRAPAAARKLPRRS